VTWLSSIRQALRALRAHKLRSGLTMLGIIIGVAAVITMLAVGSGAQAEVEEQLKRLGTNLLVVNPGSTTARGVRMGSGTRYTLTQDDALAIKREISDVSAAAPMIIDQGQVIFGGTNWMTRIHGTTSAYHQALDWAVVSGRPLDAADVEVAAKVAVLGDTVARHFFGDTDPVGQVVRVKRVPMRVVGVLEQKGQTAQGWDRDDGIFIPVTTLSTRFGHGGGYAKLRLVQSIWVKVEEGADMDHVKAEIRSLVRQRHRLPPERDDDFTLRDLSDVTAAREESTRVMTLLLGAVASISLLIGGIGIMNIMLVSVTERTREIGVRMAVGARGRDILSQFLVEAVALALAGGFCGIVLGLCGSYAIGHFAGWPVYVNVNAVAFAASFAAAIGIFFGFYPARKASRLLPIEALRYE
jgi:putative ABC transport system permease protein